MEVSVLALKTGSVFGIEFALYLAFRSDNCSPLELESPIAGNRLAPDLYFTGGLTCAFSLLIGTRLETIVFTLRGVDSNLPESGSCLIVTLIDGASVAVLVPVEVSFLLRSIFISSPMNVVCGAWGKCSHAWKNPL